MFKLSISVLLVVFLFNQLIFAQSPKKDSGKFVENINEFWDKIDYENKKNSQ